MAQQENSMEAGLYPGEFRVWNAGDGRAPDHPFELQLACEKVDPFSSVLGIGECGPGFMTLILRSAVTPGLRSGVLANAFDPGEAQKIFWLFECAWRTQTDT
jgi:hypothetical protein